MLLFLQAHLATAISEAVAFYRIDLKHDIGLFLLGAVVTAFIVLWIRGWENFREHIIANVLIVIFGTIATFSLVILWFLFYDLYEIYPQANKILSPPVAGAPKLPSWVYEPSAPFLGAHLSLVDGFTFMQGLQPGATYNLQNKQEYELTVENVWRTTANNISATVQFPFPIIASRIVETRGVYAEKFESIDKPTIVGAQVSTNGCFASTAYVFTASTMTGKGIARIRLVVEKSPSLLVPLPGVPSAVQKPQNFIYVEFGYKYRGANEHGKFFAAVEQSGGNLNLVPTRDMPDPIRARSDFLFVAPPCIPSGAL
jgi:hypothetical protein